MIKWKKCINGNFLNCQFVYPIQQKKVEVLVNDARNNKNVKKIIIFGSSVSPRCHVGSDIDVFYQLEKDERPFTEEPTFRMDYWNNFTVDDRLMAEIKKGEW